MLFARIPGIGKLIYGDALFRIKESGKKAVYLTFDDGPIPEATPLVLDILKKYNAKATFFCVGENVTNNQAIFKRIKDEGHSIGNHTYNHVNGWETVNNLYFENVSGCAKVLKSNLFRPPYGRIKYSQYKALKKKYKIVLWDVLSMDYSSKMTSEQCLAIIKAKTRAGSIIVLHDSLKSASKLPTLLPGTLDFFKKNGFEMEPLPTA
jgi:peptidoglycan/xylan/chitin deacetylase (PgdA/CDA1 family)